MNDWLNAHGGLVGLGIAAARNVLLLFSVASVTVMLERLWTLLRLKKLEATTYPLIRDALARRDFAALNEIAAQSEAPCAGVLRVGLEHTDAGEVRLREAMNQEVTNQLAALTHNLPILATAASTAPYLGLFGTVLGILAAFRDIARTGQTGASVIAGGISEALTATALGLGVAIPAVLAYNFFTARISSLSLPIETHALDIAERLAVASSAPEMAKIGVKMRIEQPGARRGARSHPRPAPMAEINIIPLVDVVLVLLIIFMATTAFVKETGLNLKLPAAKTSGAASSDSGDLTVALGGNGAMTLDGQPTDETILKAALRSRVKRNPKVHLTIKGDARIPYSRVVRVMDLAREAGLSGVALGTRQDEDAVP